MAAATKILDLGAAKKSMALAGLHQPHPDDTQEQRRRHLASLLLGSEPTARGYGPGP